MARLLLSGRAKVGKLLFKLLSVHSQTVSESQLRITSAAFMIKAVNAFCRTSGAPRAIARVPGRGLHGGPASQPAAVLPAAGISAALPPVLTGGRWIPASTSRHPLGDLQVSARDSRSLVGRLR